jgi:hypothetical protein
MMSQKVMAARTLRNRAAADADAIDGPDTANEA